MNPAITYYGKLFSLLVVLTLIVSFNIAVWGLHRHPTPPVQYVAAGRPAQGRLLIQHYGCNACHTVPGVPGPAGEVGPRLDRMQDQIYVAGILPNTPDHLAHWIASPRKVNPQTVMPDLGVSEQEARDIAAYLYQLP